VNSDRSVLTLHVTENVVQLRHVFVEHRDCRRENCMICEAGLSLCANCGALVEALLGACPGVQLTMPQHEWNYKRWIKLGGRSLNQRRRVYGMKPLA